LHRAELQARLGIELLDLGDHFGQLLRIDADRPLQSGQIVAAEQGKVVQQPGDLRIVAVAVLELQRQAFGEVAREHARRIEALQLLQHLLDERIRRTELLRQIVEVALQVARLVHHVDEVSADQPLGGLRDQHLQLLVEMVCKRAAGRHEVLEVSVLAAERVVGSWLERSPARRIGFGRIAFAARAFLGALLRVSVDKHGYIRRAPVALAIRIVAVVRALRLGALRRFLGYFGALEQGIALQLGLDVAAQLDVGELEQANSLLQLGCHHQLLALPQLQFWRKRHNGPDRRHDTLRGQVISSSH
jgi:hypothetical protein